MDRWPSVCHRLIFVRRWPLRYRRWTTHSQPCFDWQRLRKFSSELILSEATVVAATSVAEPAVTVTRKHV